MCFQYDVITTGPTGKVKGSGGDSVGNEPWEVRPPKDAVRIVFGEAPFLFKKWTILQAEQLMRFEQYHPEDFQERNWEEWVTKRFRAWLQHPHNGAFKAFYDNETSTGERDALLAVILEPFRLFDRINAWEFSEGDVSCYTYLSILGQGFLFPLCTLFIQIMIPWLLMRDASLEYLNYANCEGGDYSIDDDDDPCVPIENPLWCPDRGEWTTKVMIFCAMLVYVLKVVPDNWMSFTSKVAAGDSHAAYLQSLRKIVWDADEDTMLHKLGYRIDILMGGGFVCLICKAPPSHLLIPWPLCIFTCVTIPFFFSLSTDIENVILMFFTNSLLDIILNSLVLANIIVMLLALPFS